MAAQLSDEIRLAAWDDLLERSSDLFYLKDADGTYVDASLSFARLQGFESSDDLIGKSDADFVSDQAELARFQRGNRLVLEKGKTLHTDPQEMKTPDGLVRYYSSDVIPVRSREGAVLGTLGIMLDVTYEEVAKSVLHELSESVDKDPMTGLLNHKATFNAIDIQLKGAAPGEINALFMIDIDNFKRVNDVLGHQVGDRVICDFARVITDCFRNDDVIGRIGGDEFLVLMRSIRSEDDVRSKAAQLVDALQFSCETSDGAMGISGSVGVSICGGEGCNIQDLYFRADGQLYRSKALGKSRYNIDGDTAPQMAGSFVVENKHDSKTHTIVHLEALLENMIGFALICEVSDDIRFIYASPTAADQMLGSVSYDDDMPDTVFEGILPEDRERVSDAIRSAAATVNGRFDVVYSAFSRTGGKPIRRRAFGSRLPNSEGIDQVMLLVEDVEGFR